MHQLLTTMDTSINRVCSSHESSASAVRTCMATCKLEIAALESLVSELHGSRTVVQDSRIWLDIKNHGKKLTYPFHRSKLDRLLAQLTKVTGTLQVTLQVAGMWVI